MIVAKQIRKGGKASGKKTFWRIYKILSAIVVSNHSRNISTNFIITSTSNSKMTLSVAALASLALIAPAYAQQVGTNTAENHPPVSYQKCTASGCTTVNTQVVLDANWRWLHSTSGYANCYTGNTW